VGVLQRLRGSISGTGGQDRRRRALIATSPGLGSVHRATPMMTARDVAFAVGALTVFTFLLLIAVKVLL
jgi:hypothetical protein